MGAVQSGDLDALRAVLHDDAVLRADGGGKATAVSRPISGALAIAHFLTRVAGAERDRGGLSITRVEFNGAPGALMMQGDRAITAFHFAVDGDRIMAVYAVRNPDKLRAFGS